MRKYRVFSAESTTISSATIYLNEQIKDLLESGKNRMVNVSSPAVTMIGHPVLPRYVIAVTVTYEEK